MAQVKVHVHALAHGGAGVGVIVDPGGPLDQMRAFIEGALPNEQVQADLYLQKKRYAKGRLSRILVPSPQRSEAPCELASRCGGCNWQHLSPQAQATHKAEIALGQLRGLISRFDAVHAAPAFLGYRRRARLHVQRGPQGLSIGFFSSRSQEVVHLSRCPVLVEPLNEVLAWLPELGAWLHEKTQIHLLEGKGRVLVGISGLCPPPEDREEIEARLQAGPDCLAGISFRGSRRAWVLGSAQIELDDAIPGLAAVCAGPFDFAQAQAAQNRRMLEILSDWVAPVRGEVLELFCGSGNLTRVLAGSSRRVEAWDQAKGSIHALRRMANATKLPILPQQGKALRALARIAKSPRELALVVVDPPRTGMGAPICQRIAQCRPLAIAYVSCDPATLARDLRFFQAQGYQITRAQLVDLMPMTSEMELMVWLERKSQAQ